MQFKLKARGPVGWRCDLILVTRGASISWLDRRREKRPAMDFAESFSALHLHKRDEKEMTKRSSRELMEEQRLTSLVSSQGPTPELAWRELLPCSLQQQPESLKGQLLLRRFPAFLPVLPVPPALPFSRACLVSVALALPLPMASKPSLQLLLLLAAPSVLVTAAPAPGPTAVPDAVVLRAPLITPAAVPYGHLDRRNIFDQIKSDVESLYSAVPSYFVSGNV